MLERNQSCQQVCTLNLGKLSEIWLVVSYVCLSLGSQMDSGKTR